MIYISADQHLNHKRILEYSKRPFSSIEDHDETIIENINRVVKENDLFYILGDFSFYNAKGWRDKIKCRQVFLLRGDHDQENIPPYTFTNIFDLKQIKFPEYRGITQAVLCHWPFEIWPKKHYGSICLHGHTHLNHRFGIGRCLNVGCDQHNYSPITLHHAIDLILENEEKNGKQEYFHHKRSNERAG